MKATLLKRLDNLVGPLLVNAFEPGQGGVPSTPPRSALVVRPGGIGDAILLVPALRALMAAYPTCSVDVLAEKRNASAFLLCPGIRGVHLYDSPRGLLGSLRGGYDLVIDTEQWYRLSAVLARMTRAPRSVGFATNDRGTLFTDPVLYSQSDYEAYSFFRLLAPLGIDSPGEIAVPFLTLPDSALETAQRLLASLQGKGFAALFPAASVPKKEWGTERFRDTAAKLHAAGLKVVIVGGGDARAAGERIAEGGIALNLAGQGSLVESAAVLAKARVLVSGDSGLLHIAAGLGTPTVSIFGPCDPAKWAPKGVKHQLFRSDLPCAPCSRFGTVPPCESAGPCLNATPEQVADAVLRLWDRFGEGL